jgi:hypothetical protein
MFLKKAGGRCGCVYGTKGAVDRKSLGTTALHRYRYTNLPVLNSVFEKSIMSTVITLPREGMLHHHRVDKAEVL